MTRRVVRDGLSCGDEWMSDARRRQVARTTYRCAAEYVSIGESKERRSASTRPLVRRLVNRSKLDWTANGHTICCAFTITHDDEGHDAATNHARPLWTGPGLAIHCSTIYYCTLSGLIGCRSIYIEY